MSSVGLWCERRYMWLAAGTIFFIQLSCILEEWIFKSLPDFRNSHTMAMPHLQPLHPTLHIRHPTVFDLRSVPGGPDYYWFVALVELCLFVLLSHCGSALDVADARHCVDRWDGPGWARFFRAPPRDGPLAQYALAGLSLAGGTGLGKLAYRYLNYATGTVLKSMKLLPVMALSVLWLRRRYSQLEVAAVALMVGSAALFGLGEAELEPDFHVLGLLLSLGCLLAQAVQNNTVDRLLRDYRANPHEVMLWSNAFGAAAVLLVTVCNGELLPAVGYFAASPLRAGMLLLRCAFFYVGALLYTLLMREGGAVGAVFVTTMRKALTVIVSFVLFPKPWHVNYGIGSVLLLCAIACEFHGRGQRDAGGVKSLGAAGAPSGRAEPLEKCSDDGVDDEQRPLRR